MNRRPRLIATMLLALTFVIGGLAGMAVEEAAGLDWFDFLDEDSADEGNSLLAGLDLTGEQKKTADRILEREEDRLEEYWESRIPEIQGILQQSYAEIRVVLTPAQQAVFDRRVHELEGRVPAEIRD